MLCFSMSEAGYERVFGFIDEEALVKTTRELIAFRSVNPPGNEGEIGRYVADVMEEACMEVEFQSVHPGRLNVLGRLGNRGLGPCLLLNGHMDVVPPGEGWSSEPFDAVVRGGRVYGRGAADMKGGLAAMLEAVKAVDGAGVSLKGCLLVSAVVNEERGGSGTRFMVDAGVKPDAAVVCEPTGLEVKTCHKGALPLEFVTRGRSVHASMPHGGVNAVYKMCDVIHGLRQYGEELARVRHPLLSPPTISVDVIDGGIAPNVVPNLCKAIVDTRLVPGETVEGRLQAVKSLLDALRAEDPELDVEFHPIIAVEPMETPVDSMLVKMLRSVVEEVQGVEGVVSGFTATCDASFLANIAHTPTVIYGPGRLEQAHTADEYVEVRELVAAAKTYAALALRFLS